MTTHVKPKFVLGPDGSPLTLADLPPSNTKRWVVRRKAEVIHAVRGGLLSEATALKKYRLTKDEFNEWLNDYDKHGVAGLRVTHIQDYRR